MVPAPTPYHQIVSGRIELLLRQFVYERGLGEVFYSPIDVYFSEEDTFQPDIIFISKERLKQLNPELAIGSSLSSDKTIKLPYSFNFNDENLYAIHIVTASNFLEAKKFFIQQIEEGHKTLLYPINEGEKRKYRE